MAGLSVGPDSGRVRRFGLRADSPVRYPAETPAHALAEVLRGTPEVVTTDHPAAAEAPGLDV